MLGYQIQSIPAQMHAFNKAKRGHIQSYEFRFQLNIFLECYYDNIQSFVKTMCYVSKECKIEASSQVSNCWTPLYIKAWHLQKKKPYSLANEFTKFREQTECN